jgi:hypothetical protein
LTNDWSRSTVEAGDGGYLGSGLSPWIRWR